MTPNCTVCLSQETDTSNFSAETEHVTYVTYDLYCNMVNKEGDVEEEYICMICLILPD